MGGARHRAAHRPIQATVVERFRRGGGNAIGTDNQSAGRSDDLGFHRVTPHDDAFCSDSMSRIRTHRSGNQLSGWLVETTSRQRTGIAFYRHGKTHTTRLIKLRYCIESIFIIWKRWRWVMVDPGEPVKNREKALRIERSARRQPLPTSGSIMTHWLARTARCAGRRARTRPTQER